MNPIIGIDLGTSNTVAGVLLNETPIIIPNAEGERFTPSIVSVDKNGTVLVGSPAKSQAVLNPKGTVFSVKRFMGKKFQQVNPSEAPLPYEVARSFDDDAYVRVGEQIFSPAEISAFILKKVKQDAETFLQTDVKDAVITVPAYFNDRQRKATRAAAEIAGIRALRLINEPTAAAMAYGLSRLSNEYTYRFAVVHLGGGTLDVSLLDMGQGVYEVKAVSGDTDLGGDDFDKVIMDWAADELRQRHGVDAAQDASLLEMLKWEAELVKCELSTLETSTLTIPYQCKGSPKLEMLSACLARKEFEKRADCLLKRVFEPCQRALKDALWESSGVDFVILVGQQTRMPAVQRCIAEAFGKQPRRDVNPAEVVALGAAVEGSILSGFTGDMLLMDVTPFSLGVKTLGGVFTKLINRNETIPTCHNEIFSTAEDDQTSVEIEIFQGERVLAADNLKIGTFTLDGIPAAPRGVPQIEVRFDIEADGIIQVSAKNLSTGREQMLNIGGMKRKIDDSYKAKNQAKQDAADEAHSGEQSSGSEAPATNAERKSWLKRLFGKRKPPAQEPEQAGL